MQLNPMLIIILILPIKPIKCLPALSAITQNFHLFHQVASHDLCIIRSGDCKYHIGPINLVGKDVVSLLNEKPLCNNYKVFLKVMRSPKRRSISEFTQQGGRRKRTAFKASGINKMENQHQTCVKRRVLDCHLNEIGYSFSTILIRTENFQFLKSSET